MTKTSLAALEARNTPPKLFVQGATLVRLRRTKGKSPLIETFTEDALRGRLARSANFKKKTRREGDWVPTAPPLDVVRDIMSLPSWKFPVLDAIVEVPVLRPDGSLLLDRGYDEATRLYYAPPKGFATPAIPTSPTEMEAAKAWATIRNLIVDFPFVDGASRTNCLALLLTPILRPAIAGVIPLALIDKPAPGTGASLLAEVVAHLATGRPAAMMVPVAKEEESRKRITSLLGAGRTIIVLDNVDDALGSGSLAGALTASVWEDRWLGLNRMVSLPQRATWIATGNNLRIRGDLARRSYWIRLDAKAAHPWERTKFQHPDLLGFVRAHRGELLAAMLTVVRAWFVAGSPLAKVPAMGGFNAWAQTLGSVLAFVGEADFLGNRDALYEHVDEGHEEWSAFFEAWWGSFGAQPTTVKLLCEALESDEALLEALPEGLASSAMGVTKISSKKFGKALAKQADRIYGPYRLTKAGEDPHKKVMRWRVSRIDDGGFPDVAGLTEPESTENGTRAERGEKKAAKPSKPANEATS